MLSVISVSEFDVFIGDPVDEIPAVLKETSWARAAECDVLTASCCERDDAVVACAIKGRTKTLRT